MPEEIETAEQLIALAVLGEIVIHEMSAVRMTRPDPAGINLPPEELHAPDSPDDDAALSFSTRLDGTQLAVRSRVETSNAYGSFMVDGEAVFDLPVPVSNRHSDIVFQFVEQVGAPVVFPYIRSAVAALAAQLSVPATPLPILRAGDVILTHDDEPAIEEEPSEFFMHGTLLGTTEDGVQEQIGEFFLDKETGMLTRIGGEGQTPDADELLDLIAGFPRPEEVTAEWIVRNHGEEGIRQSLESLRQANGDAATDQMLAEVDEAVAHIEAEVAFDSLHIAIKSLDASIATFRSTDTDASAARSVEGADIPTALLDAAKQVRDSWVRVQNALSD
ncbi:hypothetical protein [Mycolicibacterium sp. GF69]|uniref:hypothetical protein n=1 Tax=Mycolicibacterium sp. GF69 TaxID=2267251 RepID=UPI001F0C9907|nr:hypothetical protein [Mycolicibacterium sp. GF69]